LHLDKTANNGNNRRKPRTTRRTAAGWLKHISMGAPEGTGSELAVKTKSIYEPAKPGDGVRVLITRYYPRGVKKDRFDRWEKALSPSRGLLAAYRSGAKSWEQFKEAFLSEMRASSDSAEAIRALSSLKARNVTLLCYERPGLNCHRYLVAEILSTPRLRSAYLGPRGGLAARRPTAREGTQEKRQRYASRNVARGGSSFVADKRFYWRRKVARKAPK